MTKSPVSPQYLDVREPDRSPGPELDRFDAVYDREFDYVWRTMGRLGVPRDELDDATHDVFLVLYRRWSDLDRSAPIRPWLFGVARRVAAGLRAKRREIPSEVEVRTDDPNATKRDLVWKSLATLDDDRRVVVILHDLEGHTGAQIAEMLGIPVNTVHSRLRLARADLVAAVRRLGGPP